jgi:hypothetical protein
MRSGLRSPCAAPVRPSTSSAISRLRGKPHHIAQQVSVQTLLQQRTKAHHLIDHRRVLGSVGGIATKPYRRAAMTTAVDKYPAAA